MLSSSRTRSVLRFAPVALAVGAIAMTATVLVGGAQRAEANPVLAANLRFMAEHADHPGTGPALHTMVAPAPKGVDVTAAVPAKSLAKRAGVLLDPTAEPVSAADNPVMETYAATTPPGRPHISALAAHVSPACTGTGTDGKRVQVVYAYESATPDLSKEAVIRNEIANVDDTYAVSSYETGGGRRVRWVADTNCVPSIVNAQIAPGLIGNAARAGADWAAVKSALAAQGLNRSDRKYLVFGDAPASIGGICGLGDQYTDERASGNYNDYYAAQYAMTWQACFASYPDQASTPVHELTHTLGAVQRNSPNSSTLGHCTDDYDVMCYPDGTTRPMRQVCPPSHEPLLDCGHDDYFSTAPVAGSYLATNWNTANSSYLDTVAPMGPRPTVTITGPSTATTGVPFTLTASAPAGVTGYSWSGPGITGSTTGRSVTVNPPIQYASTYPRSYGVIATTDSGWNANASTTVTISAAPAPKVTVTTPTAVKAGTPFTVTANATGTGALTYAWDAGSRCPVTAAANTATPTITCTGFTASTEIASVTVTQADGQTTTAQTTFSVGESAMDAKIVGPATVQVGTVGTYTMEVKNVPAGWTVSWMDQKGWIYGNESFQGPVSKILPKTVGTNTITALVASDSGGSSQSMWVDFTMTATAAPVATITGPASTPAGYGATYTAAITPAQAATYAWTSARGWITGPATGSTVVETPTATGTDTLTVTATLANGSKVTKTFTVNATAALSATMTGPVSVEAGKAATFTVTSNRTVGTVWSDDRTDCPLSTATGATTVITCPAAATGTVTVTAKVTDTVTKQVLTRTATFTLNAPVVAAPTTLTANASGTNPVTLTGTLKNAATGAALSGQPVAVQRAWYGTSTYSTVTTLTTSTTGQVTYKAPADRAGYYRFVYAGKSTLKAATSASPLVRMATKTALSVKTGYPTTFSGSVVNAVNGKAVPTGTPVALKVKWYGTTTWATVANLKTDAYGKVTWKWNANRNGYFQMVYAGNTSTVSSASASPLVRIPTKLSMSVKTGRPNVLTGRLLTGAGTVVKAQPVTLQYRPYGTTTWRALATYKTSTTGYVTAKVQPKQRTYYRWVYSGTTTGYLPATSASGYVTY